VKRPPDRGLQAIALVAAAVEAATVCWRGDLGSVDRMWGPCFLGAARPAPTHVVQLGRRTIEVYGTDPATWRFVVRDPERHLGSIHAIYVDGDPSVPTTALQKLLHATVGQLSRVFGRYS